MGLPMFDDHAMPSDAMPPEFLTTREVADLLRVKERKVYDLAAAGEIPHRRITGKLLFPRALIMRWLQGDAETADGVRPPVVTGSHDPLLDWAVRDSECGLATLFNGSADGLDTYARGEAALAGLHIAESDGWNTQTVSARSLKHCVLLGWATRRRGILVGPHLADAITGIKDLKGKRVVQRQPGSGAAGLLTDLLAEVGLSGQDLVPVAGLARTESDVAATISAGEADAALGIEAMATAFKLPFVPLLQESFDLLIDRRAYFTPPIQILMRFARTQAFHDKAAALGGYDVSPIGQVRWLSD